MNTEQGQWNEESPNKAGFDFMKSLPDLLRVLGTGALLIAMYSFLIRGWESGNDVFRYFMMLGHTGLLTVIGLASGTWLKESKGARLLITLAVVSVPVNFSILGAFIFSQMMLIDVSNYPHYVAWSVDSLSTGLLTTTAAMVILIPVIFLGFSVLARGMSKKLSLLFLFSNAALLVPLRDPQMIGLLVLALAFCAVIFSRKAAHGHVEVKTREGVTALGLQLLPLGVLIGRSLWLYSMDLFLLTVLFMTAFFIMRQIGFYLSEGSKLRGVLEFFSLISAVLVSFTLGSAIHELAILPNVLTIPLSVLVSYGMMYELSGRSQSRSDMYRKTATFFLMFGMISNLILFTGPLASLICIAVGMGLIVHGYKAQQRSLFVGGVVLMIVGLAYQFYELVHHFDLGSWASLAALGITSIVVASTIESQGAKIKPKLEAWRDEFKQWEK